MVMVAAATPFPAVGGHTSAMFYGEAASDGRSTLQKSTTAWEILFYVAMELSKEEDAGEEDSGAATQLRVASSAARAALNETGKRFVRAAATLSAFTPTLFSIRFPDSFVPMSAALKPYVGTARSWLVVEADTPARKAVLAPLYRELLDGAERLTGFEAAYDTPLWGIGLIDETSGMQRSSVMDVKIGFVRHSPLTPPEKVARMLAKEHESLMRRTALRICGARHHLRVPTPAVGAPAGRQGEPKQDSAHWQCEHLDKDAGHAIATASELHTSLISFFSVGAAMARTGAGEELAFSLDSLDDAEKAETRERISFVRGELAALLNFFEHTSEGLFLLGRLALVSASLLFVYDAAAAPHTTRVRLIDFARSTWRRFSFDEATVGFVQGLKNLDAYLREAEAIAT